MWYSDKEWWKKTLDRALRSVAQGALIGIGECVMIQQVNWTVAIGTGLGMGVISILTSIAFGLPEYEDK